MFSNDLNKARAAQILSCYGITAENLIQKSEETPAAEEAIAKSEEVVADGTELETEGQTSIED